jgi:hypothetical protein
MIKCHFHLHKNHRKAHVYSDESEDELKDWAYENNIPQDWIQHKKITHFDLFGKMLDLCENLPVANSHEFWQDIKKFKKGSTEKQEEL